MRIVTDYMGEVEYKEEEIINMPKGFYGFPESRRFILVGNLTVEFPFVWLQSIDEEELSFILTDPFLFMQDYNFEIGEDVTKSLEINQVEDVKVFTTVVIKEELDESTLNLKAPIIINQVKRLAEQVVLDSDLPYRYKFFKKKETKAC